jgi:hypothetical protein
MDVKGPTAMPMSAANSRCMGHREKGGVAGYSAHFVHLSPSRQAKTIARTERQM